MILKANCGQTLEKETILCPSNDQVSSNFMDEIILDNQTLWYRRVISIWRFPFCTYFQGNIYLIFTV